MKFSIKNLSIERLSGRIYWSLLNKIVSTKCCAILLTRSHRVVTTAVNPNVQQGNCFSFGFTELSVDEQEKRAARLKLPGQLQNSKRKKKNYNHPVCLVLFSHCFFKLQFGKRTGHQVHRCWLWLWEAGHPSGACLMARQIPAVARIASALWMAFTRLFWELFWEERLCRLFGKD